MADIVFPGQPAGEFNQEALPANYDLYLYKGDYFCLFATVKDSSGVAVDLSGAVPKAQLKLNYDDVSPIDLTCALTGTTGQVKIELPSDDASDLVVGSYIWDFQVTDSAGRTTTYLAGDVTVYDEVTT